MNTDNTRHINLRLEGLQPFSLNVQPEQEQTYRLATELVNKRYALYQQKYRNDTPDRLWARVSIEVAYALYSDARSKALKPIEYKLQDMNQQIMNQLNI